MFSEVAASNEAKELLKVLKKALEGSYDVRWFAKNEILPLYIAAVSEAFEPINTEIIEKFNEVK